MGLVSNLSRILNERGMKQKYIIEKTGLNRNTVSAIVNGSRTDIETALKIAKALSMQVEDIWRLEEEHGEN